jgi:hypothetical protein
MEIFLRQSIILFLIIIYHISLSVLSAAELPPVRGNMVIFTLPGRSIELNAVLNESAGTIIESCNRLGRLMAVEENRKVRAAGEVSGKSREEIFRKTADILKVDIYMVINAYRLGKRIYSEMRIVSRSGDYKNIQGVYVVKSRIGLNIPLKLAREVAKLHDKMRLRAGITGRRGDGSLLIDVGQWHGLAAGKYMTGEGRRVEVITTGRYRSVIRTEAEVKNGSLVIDILPDQEELIDELEERIKRNVLFTYGLKNTLLKGVDDKKRLLNGTCVINTGANVCMPGYGSFLSVRYMGIETDDPAVYGIALSSGLIATHLLLPVSLEKFRINFFPGINDDEKDENIKQLQYFLWFSLPLTFSASYFDQLAYQYRKNELLPPFFQSPDIAAATFSLFIPGGGLFFKGYRLTGWGYYLTEMFLAGYGVYHLENKKKSLYAFSLLGVIKGLEILTAFMLKPSYEFYNMEMEKGVKRVGVSIDIKRLNDTENIYSLGLNYRF